MVGLEFLAGLSFLGLAAVQLVTNRAPTEVGGLRLPGSFSRYAFPWRFWFMFSLNIAIGAFFIAGALIDGH